MLEHGGAVVPVHRGGPVDHVLPGQRGHRDGGDVTDAERRGVGGELLGDRPEDGFGVVDQVHLVDGQHAVRDAQQGGDRGMAAGLLDHAVAGVDEDHGQVGGRGAGDHVAGVLHVPGGVGQDEPPRRCGEVAVGDVDGDALFAFGSQPVGQQRQVRIRQAAPPGGVLDRLQLVGEYRLGVVQQPPDQRGLAVVHGPGGGEAQQRGRRDLDGCGHQKYPSRLRSSIAASDSRSSAREAPRSVTRLPPISAMTWAIVPAPESTAPVHDMSPTVR